jgi:DNA-binding protein H-NS
LKQDNFKSMSTDRLWAFHEQIRSALSTRMADRKREIERRFCLINPAAGPPRAAGDLQMNGQRRPYPKVFPKFQNPARPFETWAGRGKKPRWLTAQLNSGSLMDDFRIHQAI